MLKQLKLIFDKCIDFKEKQLRVAYFIAKQKEKELYKITLFIIYFLKILQRLKLEYSMKLLSSFCLTFLFYLQLIKH